MPPSGVPREGGIALRSTALVLATLVLVPVLAVAAPEADAAPGATAPHPIVVLAHLDTGINPYNVAFRDTSPLGRMHPCTYIEAYPCDVPALPLTLDAPTLEAALAADAAVWASVASNRLYWIPGTKIVGVISLGAGGTNCPLVAAPPLNVAGATGCMERRILDDHGHGTMTASRAAANAHSLCTECRLVSVEGVGAASVRWAADQGWIDVQTNSWLSLVPNLPRPAGVLPPWLLGGSDAVGKAFRHAADRMVTVAASGNGAGYLNGLVSNPTVAMSTAAPGVLLVGAHDNGRVTTWHGLPVHVVADGFGGWSADARSIEGFGPRPMSCCTSTAAPYAAGGAAGVLLEARRLLGDTGVGLRAGAIAIGAPVGAGVLADGRLTLDELDLLVRRTAEALPREGRDDGFTHWTGDPGNADVANVTAYGPGANPFCQGCWTTPVPWDALPGGAPAYSHVGYGAVSERSTALAAAVLAGEAAIPVRAIEDEAYALDQASREPLY